MGWVDCAMVVQLRNKTRNIAGWSFWEEAVVEEEWVVDYAAWCGAREVVAVAWEVPELRVLVTTTV